MSKNKFNFYTPLEIRKAKDNEGKTVMRLGGVASTIDEDSDGEFLDPSGFIIKDFQTVGVVNWHHQAKNKPSTIIGEPTKAEIRDDGFYVETDLYPNSELAREVYELAQVLEKDSKTRRLGYSIEGVIVKRGSEDENHPDYKKIKKAQITGLAITHMPKNPKTFAQIIKGQADECDEEENEEENEDKPKKSLNTESGAPLILESVDKKEKNVVDNTTINKSNYKIVNLSEKSMCLKIFDTFPDINIEKANKFYNFLIQIDNIMANTKVSDTDIQKAMAHFGLDNNDKNPFLEKSDTAKDMSPKEVADKVESETLKEGNVEEVEKGESVKANKEIKKSKEDDTIDQNEIKEVNTSKGVTLILKKSIEKAQATNSLENKALATLIKGQMEANELLKGQVSSLQETVKSQEELIKSLSGEMEKINSTPRGRKSITKGYSEKESFQKSQQAQTGQANVLSKSKNRNEILNVLDRACFAKGGYNEECGNALTLFESTGQLPNNVANRLEIEEGITIVD